MVTLRPDRWSQTVSAVVSLLLSGPAFAQLWGPEFRVNVETANYQSSVALASDGAGDFVVAWGSGKGKSGFGAFGRRFDASGAPRGGEFPINSESLGDQSPDAVAMDSAGNFFVAWSEHEPYLTLFEARAFDAEDDPLGGDVLIARSTLTWSLDPDTDAVAPQEYVVVWNDVLTGDLDIFGQRIDAAGDPIGGVFLVNDETIGYDGFPSIAGDGTGGFVVVWESYRPAETAGRIFGRRFDATGAPLGAQFPISSVTTDVESHPDVARDPDGGFVVVWGSALRDSYNAAIFARRFGADGTPSGADFQVDGPESTLIIEPELATDGEGSFLVVWESVEQDGSGGGIFGRGFDSSDRPAGEEFRVNTYTTGWQSFPAIAGFPGGGFVVAWQSEGQDGSGSGIFAQRVRIALFTADFEGGDLCAWSESTGGGSCPELEPRHSPRWSGSRGPARGVPPA